MSSEIVYSVLLPSYLEEENLRILLPRLRGVLDGISQSWEIVVVDTKTPLDATRDVCSIYGARYVNRNPSNSFGDAVRTGIQTARGRWLVFMDADGSHPPEFIPKLIANAHNQDIVIASRYTEGGVTENPWILIFMSRVLNILYAIVLSLNVKDVSNSFKLYRADIIRGLDLRCQNFDIVEEILFKIVRSYPGVRVLEVPFVFKKRMFGETKRNLFVFMATYFFTMVRLRFFTGPCLRGEARPTQRH